MWLVNLVRKILLPVLFILFFGLICIMFVWNKSSFVSNWFDTRVWFNIDSGNHPQMPKGVLGSAIACSLESYYQGDVTKWSFISLFSSGSWKNICVVYVMPIGVSFAFGIVSFTCLSISYHLLRFLIRRRKKTKKTQD